MKGGGGPRSSALMTSSSPPNREPENGSLSALRHKEVATASRTSNSREMLFETSNIDNMDEFKSGQQTTEILGKIYEQQKKITRKKCENKLQLRVSL